MADKITNTLPCGTVVHSKSNSCVIQKTLDQDSVSEGMRNVMNCEDENNQRTIDDLIAGGQYKDAYNLCLACIKNENNIAYAEKKRKELIPILKLKQKKENRKNLIIILLRPCFCQLSQCFWN